MARRSIRTWWAVLGILLVGAGAAQAQNLLREGDLIGICGDSITEQKEYSVFMQDYLLMCWSGPPVRTEQFGWGGDSMGWLLGRQGDRNILEMKPTVATTCYGMNDGGYAPVNPRTVKFYGDGMTTLVQHLKAGGVRLVVVGSPGCVDADTFHNNPQDAAMYNQTLAALRDAARQLAAQDPACVFADVHEPMMQVMAKAKAKYGRAYAFAGGDGVHPNKSGHLVMAYAFLKALGVSGDIGTITLDLASGQASAAGPHKIVSSERTNVQVESSRYPFCFFGSPKDANGTRGVIEFFAFNEELNRLRLVVTGAAPGQKLKVTWGSTSRQFTAEDLAKGINLASEFLDNPFCEAFQRVEGAIRQQQDYETTLYKGFFANVVSMRQAMREAEDPQSEEAFARVEAAMRKRQQKLAAASAAAVTPVTHVIKVEPAQ